MYTGQLIINGALRNLRFGAWVMKRLADDGISVKDIGERLNDNMFDVVPRIIYYAAENTMPNKSVDAFELTDVFDAIDELPGGMFSAEISTLLNTFGQQLSDGVPKNVQAGKKTPQAKK